jgi:hypothetical protein
MENGVIDRPAYVVAKTPEEHEVLAIPGFVKLYQKNGFSFFRKMPSKPAK